MGAAFNVLSFHLSLSSPARTVYFCHLHTLIAFHLRYRMPKVSTGISRPIQHFFPLSTAQSQFGAELPPTPILSRETPYPLTEIGTASTSVSPQQRKVIPRPSGEVGRKKGQRGYSLFAALGWETATYLSVQVCKFQLALRLQRVTYSLFGRKQFVSLQAFI